ncbi:MAG: hypothetical protein ACFFB7_08255, partial [Candidatus Sifarchaeia archaeon]
IGSDLSGLHPLMGVIAGQDQILITIALQVQRNDFINRSYLRLKRKLYRISTSFFDLNKRIKKRDFFESLYQRIARVMA